MIKKLNLSDNKIKSCSLFEGHATLELLELRKNRLKTLEGVRNCPNLKELYCDENIINDWNHLNSLFDCLISF